MSLSPARNCNNRTYQKEERTTFMKDDPLQNRFTVNQPPPYLFTQQLRIATPYDHLYTTYIKRRWIGNELLAMLTKEFRAYDTAYYKAAILSGKIRLDGQVVTPTTLLRDGQKLTHSATLCEPPVPNGPNQRIRILEAFTPNHTTPSLGRFLVVEKPCGIPIHPGAAYRRNSLIEIIKARSDIWVWSGKEKEPNPCHNCGTSIQGPHQEKNEIDSQSPRGYTALLSENQSILDQLDEATQKRGVSLPQKPPDEPNDISSYSSQQLSQYKDELQNIKCPSAPCPAPSFLRNHVPWIPPLTPKNTRITTLVDQQCATHNGYNGSPVNGFCLDRLRPLHRLDRLTSGIVIFSDCSESAALFERAIRTGQINKVYCARVKGDFRDVCKATTPSARPHCSLQGYVVCCDPKNAIYRFYAPEASDPANCTNSKRPEARQDGLAHHNVKKRIGPYVKQLGTCEVPPLKHARVEPPSDNIDLRNQYIGKSAETDFEFIAFDATQNESVILCYPRTGRTHQLRTQLLYLGHPISNDPCYGPEPLLHQEWFPPIPHEPRDLRNANDSSLPENTKKPTTDLHMAHSEETPHLHASGIFLHAWRYDLSNAFSIETPLPNWFTPVSNNLRQ